MVLAVFFFSSRRRHTIFDCDWSSDVCSSDLPAAAWKPGISQDGTIQDDKHVAEITHLMSRAGKWPAGLRFICRRAKPARRQMKNLTPYEKKTGGRDSGHSTDITGGGLAALAGNPHPPHTRR